MTSSSNVSRAAVGKRNTRTSGKCTSCLPSAPSMLNVTIWMRVMAGCASGTPRPKPPESTLVMRECVVIGEITQGVQRSRNMTFFLNVSPYYCRFLVPRWLHNWAWKQVAIGKIGIVSYLEPHWERTNSDKPNNSASLRNNYHRQGFI